MELTYVLLAAVAVVAAFLCGRSMRMPAPAPAPAAAPRRKSKGSKASQSRKKFDAAKVSLPAIPGSIPPASGLSELSGLPNLADPDTEDGPHSQSKSMVSYIDELAIARASAPLSLVAGGQADRARGGVDHRYAFLEDKDRALCAVADGLSGHAGGAMASKLAMQSLLRCFEAPAPDAEGSTNPKRPEKSNRLVWAVEEANRAIYTAAQTHPEYNTMGSALVAALFLLDEANVCIAHVGDSRAYRMRQGRCQILTADHTLASKGVSGPMATKLYRALGLKARVKVDLVVATIEPGDVYLFCTDGFVKSVDDAMIERLLNGEEDPVAVAAKMVAAADESDRANIVVLVARVGASGRVETRGDASLAG